ncbi:hypothetical protein B5X24_HaOG206638 [Helicoverpa armigera]|nr:hypothetical protein B5X24_HaOG206638 [Helicoverpa armigera]
MLVRSMEKEKMSRYDVMQVVGLIPAKNLVFVIYELPFIFILIDELTKIIGRLKVYSGYSKRIFLIQGKPIIQQRILPSPVVSIDAPHTFRSTPTPIDEHNNIIFSPWKAFGPFVDTIQEGELLPSQDTVVLPSPRHHDSSMDEDATDPMPTPETSNKVASISQLSFMVRPDSFERGQLRLTCISTVHSVYSEQAELVINEERPQIASVLGTRDAAGPVAESLLLMLEYPTMMSGSGRLGCSDLYVNKREFLI